MGETSLELWLVRHARPLVVPGTCYGRLDVPADLEHTLITAHRLKAAWEGQGARPQSTQMWHSPVQRCAALASACAGLGLPPSQSLSDLQEMDFGHWEGRLWESIDRAAIDGWTQNFLHHRPGDGESVQALLNRTQSALEHCQRKAQAHGSRTLIWLTHAGVIRAVECLLNRGALGWAHLQAQDWPTTPCDFGSWRIHTLPDHRWGQTRYHCAHAHFP